MGHRGEKTHCPERVEEDELIDSGSRGMVGSRADGSTQRGEPTQQPGKKGEEERKRRRKGPGERNRISSEEGGKEGGRERGRSGGDIPFSACLAETSPFSNRALRTASREIVVAPIVILATADAATPQGRCEREGGREGGRKGRSETI